MKRFWDKVNLEPNEHGCLLWTAAKFTNGYGVFSFSGKHVRAHRMAFYLRYGRWPYEDKILAHLCEDYYEPGDLTAKICVNTDHLVETTHKENIRMAFANGRRDNATALARKIHKGKQYSAQLTPDCVRWIRYLYNTGDYTQKVLGELFECSEANIQKITNYTNWKNI